MSPEIPPKPENSNPLRDNDLQALAELRDQLADYLATVERNTDAVNTWLTVNKNKIIMFHQQLERALNDKDEAKAISLIAQMGDVAGFVLSLQNFEDRAGVIFGNDNAFQKTIVGITDVLPASLQEPLPQLPESAQTILPRALMDNQPIKPEEKAKWHSAVSNWFNKEEKLREKSDRNFRLQLRAVKAEILGLQGERHYYIDSFMDWIADTLTPEAFNDNGKAPDNAAKMLQYQNPAYIIGLAHADHREAVDGKAKIVREAALEYSRLANAIDRQDVAGILGTLKSAYPARATQDSETFKKILLEDYQSKSLAELILKHIDSRASQYKLLQQSSDTILREPLTFTGAKTPQQIFEKFLRLVLDENNPLNPSVLHQVLATLKKQKDVSIQDLAFSALAGEPNVFQRVIERFKDDIPAQRNTLVDLLTQSDTDLKAAGVAGAYVALHEALRHKDEEAIKEALSGIGQQHTAQQVISLWQLCHPGSSLLEEIRSVSADPEVKGALLGRSVSAGLLGELKIDGNYPYGYGWQSSAAKKFEKLMQEDVLPALDTFPIHTARLLIAHTFSTGGLQGLRSLLTTPTHSSWLAEIVFSEISDQKKAEWVAALLEPFPSDIVKANILAEAARNTLTDLRSEMTLSSLEKNMVGENIRLTEDKILCNLPRIANIWYNSDYETLRYTVQGQSHTLLENVAPDMAREILSLIQRRGNFMEEKDGLFKPENIDAIHHSANGATISWHRAEGALNADVATLAALKNHCGFLHVTDRQTGNLSSYNIASICLLQKMEDCAWLMIDKYGTSHVLDGQIGGALLPSPGSIYFNPDNASIIRLNQKKNSLSFEFRIESADFEKLMDADSNQFFYSVTLADAADLAALKKTVEKNADIHAPNQETLPGLYFNMKALGYLAFDERASGFYCRRYSPTNKPGFIQVEHDMAEEIMAGLGAESNIIRVGDLMVHENSVDDAYYNAAKEKLQFVIGREIQEVHAASFKGWGTLARLAQNKRFTAIADKSVTLDPNSVTDAVQLSRATLITHNPEQERTHVITENLPFHINLGGEKALTLLDSIEEQGLATAKAASKAKAWTQDVGAALENLPKLAVTVSPVVDMETPQVLLQQALGLVKTENGAAKTLKASFATVASLPAAYERFAYPEQKKSGEPKQAPSPKKPRPPAP
ncbi:MAG: hypothetical protein K8R48_00840 [Alphaproteobacteria bacterium]|nr:hypothetical protein [Alphaproteobacteria bacterium]